MVNLSNIFISDSFADTTTNIAANTNELAAAPQTGIMNFVPLILIFLVFYFLLIRPQQKKIKQHQNTLNHLKNGDKVQTSSGIFGVIKAIDKKDGTIDLEIAPDVTIKILKQSIADIIKKKNLDHSSKNNKTK